MKTVRRHLITGAVEVGVILLLHRVLLHVMADRHVVSTILAGGNHIPRSVAFAAGLFVLVRCYAVLLLPGVVFARIAALLLDLRADQKASEA